MNVLSLFSGIGGLELGLERAGMTVVGQVEIDEFCRRVLAKHWPEVPRHDDVRTAVEWWRSEPRPAVHVVCGGFPCQGHSVAGRRRGTGDERWGWPWYRTVVEGIEPPWILVENVPNLVRTGLRDVLVDLADLGFDAWWGCVPAAAVGAPHLRWRLFVIAAHPGRVQLRNEPRLVRGADGQDPTVVGHDGATWALADADCSRRGERSRARTDGTGESQSQDSSPVAHADGNRLQGCDAAGTEPGQPGEARFGRRSADAGRADGAASSDANCEPAGWTPITWQERDHWAAEPDVGRVADGVPARVDRLRGLGNAVVPQVAEHVGRLIVAAAHLEAEVSR